MQNGTKIYKYSTGFATGESWYTTSSTPPGTPAQRANGVFGGLQATYTAEKGRLIDSHGIDRGPVDGLRVWN